MMFRIYLFFWIVLLDNVIAEDIICSNTKKCMECKLSETEYIFKCPSNVTEGDQKTDINIYPASKKIRIICNEKAEIFNNSVLPNVTFHLTKELSIEDCTIRDNGLNVIINNFEIKQLKRLKIRRTQIVNESFAYYGNFDDMKNLERLDLENNKIVSKSLNRLLENTPNLSVLNLDRNEIELFENTFDHLTNLNNLSLAENKITKIPKYAFRNLKKLKLLSLWGNKLESIDIGVFDGDLKELKILDLAANKINYLENNIFNNLSNLSEINLRKNDIRNISRSVFGNCRKLTMIKLDENYNISLIDDVFSNFTFLKEIDLSYNNLENLSATLFKGSINIRNLYLTNNKLSNFPTNLFQDLENLEGLYLQNNEFIELNAELLNYLRNLKIIDLSYNKIKSIHPFSFSGNGNLKVLIMRHNEYNFINDSFTTPFSSCKNLKKIDLGYNHITRFPYALSYSAAIEEINLEHNWITHIELNSLQTVRPQGWKINLEFNKISSIDFEDINDTDYREIKSIIKVSYNPIICDCNALHLVQHIQKKNSEVLPNMKLHFSDLICAKPITLKDFSLSDIKLENLTCSLNKTCDQDNICDCNYRSLDKRLIINCSKKNLTEIPKLFYSQHSEFQFHQIEVDLQHNNLEYWPNEFDGYNETTILNLMDNKIKNVTWLPKSLEILDLSENSFKSLDDVTIKLLNESGIKEMYLGKNPWKCDCQMFQFSKFLNQFQKDWKGLNCVIAGKNLDEKDFCPTYGHVLIILIFIILSCFLLITTMFLLYFKYKTEIQVWCYARGIFLWLITEEEVDKDKIYDAFLSYSHVDEDFLNENLISILENKQNPYKLCIHRRDWIPGEFIQKQIYNSVKDSRRTIIFLTKNFLESVWGVHGFRIAHAEALKERRARVIVIVYGDIDIDSLDDEFKAYFSTNTYIEWNDRWFWDKLQFALPRRKDKKISRKHINILRYIDAKFKLSPNQEINNSTILQPYNLEEKSMTCAA